MNTLVTALVVGLFVGIIVGALGAGGGILSVPILTYVLAQDAHTATAESLIIVIATALVSLPHHIRTGHVRWRRGLIFAAISVIGSVAGGRANALVPGFWLMLSFAVLLAAVSGFMVRSGLKARVVERAPDSSTAASPPRTRPMWQVAMAALTTGLLTGFFGVGGGFVVVPMLVLVLGVGMRDATGTSLLIMVIASLGGLAGRIGTPLNINWGVTAAFAAGSMVGGVAGGPLSSRARPSTLTLAFGCLLVVVALFVGAQTLLFPA